MKLPARRFKASNFDFPKNLSIVDQCIFGMAEVTEFEVVRQSYGGPVSNDPVWIIEVDVVVENVDEDWDLKVL